MVQKFPIAGIYGFDSSALLAVLAVVSYLITVHGGAMRERPICPKLTPCTSRGLTDHDRGLVQVAAAGVVGTGVDVLDARFTGFTPTSRRS